MALKLKQTIPLLQVNEDSELTPIDLNTYIDNPDNVQLRFNATLTDGQSLPDNITVNEEGVLSGDAEAKTAKESPYNVTVIAQCEGVEPLFFDIQLKINSSLNPDEEKEEGVNLENKKNEFADYWEKFAKKLELPDLDALLSRKVSASEVYYLLGRFATLVIWNSDDLTPANEGKLIEIEGSSDHYSVYDFDIALVASPKELYNGDRCLNDSLLTAKAMVQEIKRRKWNIEFAGYDKMVTAAWIEVQRLNDLGKGHQIQVVGYEPTVFDMEVLMHVLKK